MREPAWRREGEAPDYRFSLANERTFLAWTRTAMAILAGAIPIGAYRRWRAQEQSMRHHRELPHSWLLAGLATAMGITAVVFCVVFLVS